MRKKQALEMANSLNRSSAELLWEANSKLKDRLELAEKVIFQARKLKTHHSGYCATVECQCSGEALILVRLEEALKEYDMENKTGGPN